jgi:sugar diacid utilization regulator
VKGLVKYLQEIYENCEIPFEVYADEKIIFKTNPSPFNENLLENTFLIGTKEFKINAEEKRKDFMKVLEFCIKDKYKADHNKKEKIIIQLLQKLSVSKEKIKEIMPPIKEDTFLIVLNLKEKVIEALDTLKNIYNSNEIAMLTYEDTVILIGIFEDINEHVSSINETISLSLYEKCYIGYCHIEDYELLNKLYSENIYKINLAKKYNISHMIFGQNSLLFEEIMDNLKQEIKEKMLNNFNEGFSNLDEDMVKTIEVFFKSDLNLSEASKELYVHRNTLIYRLDKIQKYTGYDIRKFNDAALFKIAFFIWKQKNKI